MKRILTLVVFTLCAVRLLGAGEEFTLRGGLPNCFNKTSSRSLKIVYLGGSITAAENGWRDLIYNWFRINYPETVITQVNAAMGGTGSDLGLFRTQSDVLSANPDLVFVEYAVNDGHRTTPSILRSMEGIVRKIWAAMPHTDICFVYTTDRARFEAYRKGTVAHTILAHEQIADHYGIPSINMTCRVAQLADQGKLTFTAPVSENARTIVFTSDEVHPLSESGHPIYASVVTRYLAQMASKKGDKPHKLPVPLVAENWENANKVELSKTEMSGWTLLTDGELVNTFSRFTKNIWQGKPGSTLSFSFRGTALGLYDFLGPRSGKIFITLDGKCTEYRRFDRHCSYWRLNNQVMIEDLKDTVHHVKIEVSGEQLDKASILGPEHLEKLKQSPEAFKGIEYHIANLLIVGDLIKFEPVELEARIIAADSLWRTGKVEQAAAAYALLSGNEGCTCPEEYQSLICLRLAEAQLALGQSEQCRGTLKKMESLGYLPSHHRIKMGDLHMKLDGKAVDYRTSPDLNYPVAAALHVDQQVCKQGDGSAKAPFQRIEQALQSASAIIASGKAGKGAVEIVLHGPFYRIDGTIRMGAAHSGTAANPLVIRSADPVSPTVITGGVPLSKWKQEKDPAVLALLPASSRGKVLVADLKENGVTGIDEIVFGGFGSGRSQSGTYRFNTMPVPELFCDGKLQTLARWPNHCDTIVSVNKFNDPRAGKWDSDDDAWLHGYWKYLYADSYEKIEAFQNHRLKLTPPYNRYGFSDESRGLITESKWYALNLLSEMDLSGEWKISAAKGKIWLFPDQGFDPAQCILSTYGAGIVMKQCDNVVIRNVGMTYMRGDGVVATDCNNLAFIGCEIRNLSGLGIQILGGQGHLLHSLRIDHMGRGGIYLQSGDKATLAPSNSVVENCHISDLSHIDRTYTPAVLIDGVGIKVQHCLFENIPSSAIRLEGNDMLIQCNEIRNCVLESNDQGTIDIWFSSTFRGNVIRWNYFHDNGSQKMMVGAVRMDDAISGVYIAENIMQRTASGMFGAVQIHGGNYNMLEGNIFIENKAAVSNTPWPDEYWLSHFRNDRTVKLLSSVPWQGSEWMSRYPDLRHMYDNPNKNFIRDNKVIGCAEYYVRNSLNPLANWVDRFEFFRNDITVLTHIEGAGLRSIAATCDPWHAIPVSEIGTYNKISE